MNDPIIIGIIGMGYNGSTILNFIFDTHSKIYGGGELHWLTKVDAEPIPEDWMCTECGAGCRYWTSERILSCTCENIHQVAADTFRVNVIADTSKNIDWFLPKIKSRPGTVVPVLLVKHPLRHLASFVSLRTISDFGEYGRWKKFKMWLRRQSPEDDIIETYLNYMDWYYRSGVSVLNEQQNFAILRYEDVVTNMENALSPILKICGLEFEPAMLRPFVNEHHQIGGNTGPVYLKSGKWTGDMNSSHQSRVRHYEDIKKKNSDSKSDKLLFLDNKFEKVLSQKQIEKLLKNKKYRQLCDRFNYEYDLRIKEMPERA